MQSSRANLTGEWSGEFSYPSHLGPTTPFLARLQDDRGLLTGAIIEPDTVTGGPTVSATLVGHRHGQSVDFTKTYDPPAPFGYDNPIDYVGSISSDGNTIRGMWSMLEWDGTFEMRREAEAVEDVEAEAQVEMPMPESAR